MITTKMYIPALRFGHGKKLIAKSMVRGEAGKKNLFVQFRNGLQDIDMYSLGSTHRVPVKKKEKPRIRFLP